MCLIKSRSLEVSDTSVVPEPSNAVLLPPSAASNRMPEAQKNNWRVWIRPLGLVMAPQRNELS
jgi:hypothetical protein